MLAVVVVVVVVAVAVAVAVVVVVVLLLLFVVVVVVMVGSDISGKPDIVFYEQFAKVMSVTYVLQFELM